MARTKTKGDPPQRLRELALRYPEAEEGVVCNRSSFKARGKAFFFLGVDDRSYKVLLKLRDSLPEAAGYAGALPDSYIVGKGGWVTVTLGRDEAAPPGVLEGWIDESYRLLAHKSLVATLPERGPSAGARPGARKPAAAKATASKPATARKPASKPTSKTAARKTAAAKSTARKTAAAKTTTSKRAAAKKPVAAEKSARRPAVAKKSAAVEKPTRKSAPAKKSASKPAPAKKSASKPAAGKSAAGKR